MQAMVCEMCGSHELLKTDGIFICQSCGTRYSPEEAKKLLIEVTGAVKIDNSEKIKNYYLLARRAREFSNIDEAAKYYDLIRSEIPNDWEASFFATYYYALKTNIAGIESAAITIANAAISTLEIIRKSSLEEKELYAACTEVTNYTIIAARLFFDKKEEYYNEDLEAASSYIGTEAYKKRFNELYEERNKYAIAISHMLFTTGDTLESLFENKYNLYEQGVCSLWELGINILYTTYNAYRPEYSNYVNKIIQYKPDYVAPHLVPKPKSGCYVATAIYGSYDCPQVWTLRRYRDDTLARTWYGRAFIHTYYAVSPTLVKWFGNTNWFKNMWKPKLDRMVERLNGEGVENTPYYDKKW